MQGCDRFQKRMSAYWDGEITSRDRKWMDRHIQACPCCRRKLDGMARLEPQLADLIPPVAPGWLESRITACAEAQMSRPWWAPWLERGIGFSCLPRALSTTALVLGLIMGSHMGSQFWSPGTALESAGYCRHIECQWGHGSPNGLDTIV